MYGLILRRIAAAILTISVLTVFVFALLYLFPGDPGERILQTRMNGELPTSRDTVEVLKKEMGLDAPPYQLYLNWARGVLHGDLGYSYVTRRPVITILSESLRATGELVMISMLIVMFFGLALGFLAAWKEDSWIDDMLSYLAILGISVPGYVTAFVLILIFAIGLHLLPVAGRSGLYSMLMPAASLSFGGIAMLMRMTRYDILEESRQDYVLAAKAKGLGEARVFFGHIFRNSLPPLVTYLGLELGGLFGGAVIVENIFAWPGIGRLLVDSVQSGDVPLVQASVLLIGVIFILINIIVDLLYTYIDPRIDPEGVL
ncbi:MAG: ABC transporter permease [Methanothrix soehngenii]|jgi:peptide/nickel transport system permease protein|uniref:ABC transporter permease n=1 Tax=Methanothrix soehngenii TaxID=2223 RepID=UPI0023F3FE96|nr:ABC transporter permease [Methanothrix soehngenii]MDD5256732.1 ABC transporter permease [Methanothrix soehngenii]